MIRQTLVAQLLCAVTAVLASALYARADAPSVKSLSAAELAQRIDHWLAKKWNENGVAPAAAADDAEFVRRVYLDLAGRIPRVAEVRGFLADQSADKRQHLIEKLLKSGRYVQHFTNTWSDILLPVSNDPQVRLLTPGFRGWVEKQVRDNVPYNQVIRELLTVDAALAIQLTAGGGRLQAGSVPSPAAFYLANELKPENLAASSSRLFLGIQVECAQCHDHPFASWKRKQFWEFAAFFSGVQQFQRGGVADLRQLQPNPNGRRIKIPDTDQVVEARYLTGQEPKWEANSAARTTLANWITAEDNPYFARTAVNRVWAHFFGIGLIDPVDEEPTADNPISHPELLNELSEQFVAHNFDVKYMIRAVAASRAYQLSSTQTAAADKEESKRLFVRMPLRGMTAEQLFDSLSMATGYRDAAPPQQDRIAAVLALNTPRAEFLSRFESKDKRTEKQTSILQALALMNGKLIADATSVERSMTLAAVADVPFMSNAERVDTLFLATLSRMPRQQERDRLVAYVERGGSVGDERKALADVFWTLLNSSEFILNH